jgi:hypothetical protein
MMLPDYLGASMSAVDELLAYKIEELIRQKDEERIIHERQKTEQLKELERQRKTEIKRIQDEANEELEYVVERVKHEIKLSQEGGVTSEEARKKELTRQKQAAVAKALEKWTKQEEERKEGHDSKFADRMSRLKDEEESRHQREADVLKRKFEQKTRQEKDR